MRTYEEIKTINLYDYKGDFKSLDLVYRVKFSKVSTSHEIDPVRTEEIEGNCTLPRVGEQFFLVSEPLVSGSKEQGEYDIPARHLSTSPVQELWENNGITYLKTESSVYSIEVIDIII